MPHSVRISDNGGRDRAFALIGNAPDGHVVTFERKMTLANGGVRMRAMELAEKLKSGWLVKVTKRNRSLEQNRLLWVLLTDVSVSKPLGRTHTPEVWKQLFMQACGHEVQFEMGLDGRPFPVGHKSSQLKVSQMTDLIEFIYSWGAQNGVAFSEKPETQQAA